MTVEGLWFLRDAVRRAGHVLAGGARTGRRGDGCLAGGFAERFCSSGSGMG